jgi:tellurite resistance protein TehA-like permease
VRRWERWTFNGLSLAVAATGFAYLWMKYLLQNDDPFAVVNHPWQAGMLDLHVVASPAFILMFGIVFNSHVMRKLRATRLPNRRSGFTSLGTFAAMILSGYLLQVSSDEGLLRALVVLHIASGIVFSASYAVHLVISARLARIRPSQAVPEVA